MHIQFTLIFSIVNEKKNQSPIDLAIFVVVSI